MPNTQNTSSTPVTQAVVELAERRDHGVTGSEPGATARALMRGDATPAERRAVILTALTLAGIMADGFTPVPSPVRVTPHQQRVLELLSEGLSTTQVAARIPISFATAKNHVRNLLARFGVSSRVELLVEATRYGWLPLPTTEPVEQATVGSPSPVVTVEQRGRRWAVLVDGEPVPGRFTTQAAAEVAAERHQ